MNEVGDPAGAGVLKAAPDLNAVGTAEAMRLARAAGAPVPVVLDAGQSGAGGWPFLLRAYVEGEPWLDVCPLLGEPAIAEAHRQLGDAVRRVHSVRFDGFGELGEPPALDLISALRRRAAIRIRGSADRELFDRALERFGSLFEAAEAGPAVLCHDDLHRGNVIFRTTGDTAELVAIIDWDKAWAGPAESDLARLAFWDDMTGPEFWAGYRDYVPDAPGAEQRRLVYQLLWCLEYAAPTARHQHDTAAVCRQLGLAWSG